MNRCIILIFLILLINGVSNTQDIGEPYFGEEIYAPECAPLLNREGHLAKDNVLPHPVEQEILDLVNRARANPDDFAELGGYSKGQFSPCLPLVWNADLILIARQYAEEMARGHFFEHGDVGGRCRGAGYDGAVGENIARGYPTGYAAFVGWMNSPGHRANILNCAWTEIGIGYAYVPSAGASWDRMYVQDFGRREPRDINLKVDKSNIKYKPKAGANPFFYSIDFTVDVIGRYDVGPLEVSVYDGNPNLDGKLIDKSVYFKEVVVSTGSISGSVTWNTKDLSGVHHLYVIAEPKGGIGDVDSSNNSGLISINLSSDGREVKENIALMPIELDLLSSINEIRADPSRFANRYNYPMYEYYPMSGIILSADLLTASRNHTKDMMEKKYISTTSLDGKTPEQQVRDNFYWGDLLGSYVFAIEGPPKLGEILNQWITNSEIRNYLLSEYPVELGIGVESGGPFYYNRKNYLIFNYKKENLYGMK